jgi:DNA-binding transcriptional MocR family regulator
MRTVQVLREDLSRRRYGDLMPSNRQVMAKLGVGPVTVRRAVAQLVSEGLLTTRSGIGTYVSRPAQRPAADTAWQQVALGPSRVDPAGLDVQTRLWGLGSLPMASGYLDASLRPDGRIAAAIARAARRPDAWGPPSLGGLGELRSWFAAEIGVDREEILISSGCQGAMSAIMRSLLPPGSPVLFGVPTYPGALAVARSAGLVPVPVPCDADGIRPELLERAFLTTGARLLYMQPTFANPDGRALPAVRRPQVIDAAKKAGAFILEDDWARWLGHGPSPAPPLARDDVDGHVVTITSLTKAVAPSLRVGAVAARGPVLQRIAAMRLVDEFFVSRPLQEAAVELVTGAGWQAHLRSLASSLRQRWEALSVALERHLPGCTFEAPAGGVFVWVQLPKGCDEQLAVERSLAAGVAVSPGRLYVIGEAEHPHMRISFSGVPASAIDEAVRRLAGAINGGS